MANQQLSMSPLDKKLNKLREKKDKLELELMKIDEEMSTLLQQLPQQPAMPQAVPQVMTQQGVPQGVPQVITQQGVPQAVPQVMTQVMPQAAMPQGSGMGLDAMSVAELYTGEYRFTI